MAFTGSRNLRAVCKIVLITAIETFLRQAPILFIRLRTRLCRCEGLYMLATGDNGVHGLPRHTRVRCTEPACRRPRSYHPKGQDDTFAYIQARSDICSPYHWFFGMTIDAIFGMCLMASSTGFHSLEFLGCINARQHEVCAKQLLEIFQLHISPS